MTPYEIDRIHDIDAVTRFHLAPKCELPEYKALHTSLLIPTSISFDVDHFRQTMDKYSDYFKSWSNNRPDMWHIRKGLPLVNLTGKYDEEVDITLGPLDFYNKNNPTRRLWETDITTKTPILFEECFKPLHILNPYLIRTSILKWIKGANFLPHIDLEVPTPHFRLWGTDNPDVIKLRFKNSNGEFDEVQNVEPGRLYIIDTAEMHDALCIDDMGYQFFVAVNVHAYDLLMSIKV